MVNKILITINVKWWNAEAAYAINLARVLKEHGHQVWVLTFPNGLVSQKAQQYNLSLLEGIKLDTYSPLHVCINFKRLLHFIDENQITVINSFKSNGAFLFSLIRYLRPQLRYFKTRAEARPPSNNFINRYLYGLKGCDGVIAASKIIQEWLYQLKINHLNTKVIYYSSYWQASNNANLVELRQNLKIAPNMKIGMIIGRNQPVKGHMVLLEAIKLLKEQDAPFHCICLIKDLEEFPDELSKMQQYIYQHQLENHVSILGFQKNLIDFINLCDFGIIPSLGSEVICRVAVEFFAASKPVAAFPTGTLPEIVNHQQNGFVCNDKTARALTEAIQWMITNEERLSSLQKAALTKYQNEYVPDILYQETIDFFHSKL